VAKRSRSGLKHKRQDEKRRLHNQSILSRLKTLKKAAATPQSLGELLAEFDRAARKGIIHPNTAARKKSRLMRKFTTGIRQQGNAGTKATP